MERDKSSAKFPFGSNIPHFSLPNVDGREIGEDYFKGAKLSLVVFTCNHCPYVKGSEAALIALAKRYESSGLKTITINSNDAAKYPEDSFEKMKEKARNLSLPYPYLYDESQEIARLFDAQCTPECYLFDDKQKLIFHGTINDNLQNFSLAKKHYLAQAIAQALEGKTPDPSFIHPIGCSIKWK